MGDRPGTRGATDRLRDVPDAPADETFDRLTRLAAATLHVPVAVVAEAYAGGVLFRSALGVPARGAAAGRVRLARASSEHIIASRQLLVIEDVREHPLSRSLPAHAGLGGACAGVPLTTGDGDVLGALCVVNRTPRPWSADELHILRDLAASAMSEMRLRAAAREREGQRQRLALLSKASEVLMSALDEESMLRRVVALTVPVLADWCSVYLEEEDRGVRHLATAHADPATAALARAVGRRYARHPMAPGNPAARVLRSSRPRLIPEVAEADLEHFSLDRWHLESWRALAPRSAMAVPLIAGRRRLGTMLLVATAHSERRYTPADLALARELARRCALAIAHAGLCRAAQQQSGKRGRAEKHVRLTAERLEPRIETEGDAIGPLAVIKDPQQQSNALARLEERERIAMDLHDGVIQSLYGVMLGLAGHERTLDEQSAATRATLRAARAQLIGVIGEVREYMIGLRSADQPEARDLRSGLERLAQNLRTTGLRRVEVEVDSGIERHLSPGAVQHLLYIAREATSNVIRHALASAATIRMTTVDGKVVLVVADDGRGLSPGAHGRRAGDGLRNMAERVQLLGGGLEIRSQPGQGTEVRVEVPAPAPETPG